jgi:hypothetical protein
MPDDHDERAEAELRRAIQRIAGSETRPYEHTRARLASTSRIVREELAAILQPAINGQAAAMPHETYEEKKTLANWINRELRQLGLAIRCPRTGEPCLLQAGPARDHVVGRFRLDYMDESGRRHSPSSSVSLPQLELMPDPQVHTPFRIRNPRSR